MKLLLYSHFFPPSVGGTETIVLALARGLAGYAPAGSLNAFDVTVVTQTPQGDYPDAGLPFHVVRRPAIFQLRKLIDAADLVHVAGAALPPMLWGLWLNKPVIVEHHGYQAICPTGMLLKLPELSVCPGYFRQREYGKCLQCLAQESGWLRAWQRLLWQFPRFWLTRRVAGNIAVSRHEEQRIDLPLTSVIYHGIAAPPPGDYASPPVPSPSQRIHFAFLGRLVAEKGANILVAAARILREQRRDFFLSIIGDGPERPRVEQAIQAAGLQEHVRVLGFMRGEELTRALAPIQVIVMPSIWEETAGLSAIENMMRGRVVIASAIGGLQEMAGDAAILAEPGNPASLAESMSKVIENPGLLASYGQKARERATQLFELRTMVEAHARLYEKVDSENFQ
jgi:glycosyltransferase involved in cell wall biosynthesis